MNRKAFYAHLRKRSTKLFGTSLSKGQVQGLEAILDECEAQRCDVGQAAYVLATGHGETGGRMQAVRENLNYRASQVAKHFGAHRRQGKTPQQLARNPVLLGNTVYGGPWGKKNLGNTQPGDGYAFRGFGLGQWTGRRHAERLASTTGLDIVRRPELLDDIKANAQILVRDMLAGGATGRKLSEFVSGSRRDYHGARKVWGGVNASKYVWRAQAFEAALDAAGYKVGTAPKPKDPTPKTPKGPTPPTAPKTGGWAALFAAIAKLFGRK